MLYKCLLYLNRDKSQPKLNPWFHVSSSRAKLNLDQDNVFFTLGVTQTLKPVTIHPNKALHTRDCDKCEVHCERNGKFAKSNYGHLVEIFGFEQHFYRLTWNYSDSFQLI